MKRLPYFVLVTLSVIIAPVTNAQDSLNWHLNGNPVTNGAYIGTNSIGDYFPIVTEMQERMRVDTGRGYIGIGTPHPKNLQHLNKLTANDVYSQFTNATTGDTLSTSGFRIGIDANGNAVLFNNYSDSLSGNMNFSTNGTQKMTILGASGSTDGNVGIGTATPSEKLEVNGNLLVNGKILVAEEANTYDLLAMILQLQNEVAELKQQMAMTKN